ncbi:MAG: hypothetical protein ACXVHX_15310 [Solirubrobacteraceae bacterium]
MAELLIRIGVHSLLEDYRYQRAIDQLIAVHFMGGRSTDGDDTLPAVR